MLAARLPLSYIRLLCLRRRYNTNINFLDGEICELKSINLLPVQTTYTSTSTYSPNPWIEHSKQPISTGQYIINEYMMPCPLNDVSCVEVFPLSLHQNTNLKHI